jgi:hypothetical protein
MKILYFSEFTTTVGLFRGGWAIRPYQTVSVCDSAFCYHICGFRFLLCVCDSYSYVVFCHFSCYVWLSFFLSLFVDFRSLLCVWLILVHGFFVISLAICVTQPFLITEIVCCNTFFSSSNTSTLWSSIIWNKGTHGL